MSVLKSFRVLIVIYAVTALIGFREFASRSGADAVPVGDVDLYSLREESSAHLLKQLYPDRAEVDFINGMQVGRYLGDVDAARRHFERALGDRTNHLEGLFVNYIQVLILQEADPALIDQTISSWKQNFPRTSEAILIPYETFSGEGTPQSAASGALLTMNWVENVTAGEFGPREGFLELRVRGRTSRIAAAREALEGAGFVF